MSTLSVNNLTTLTGSTITIPTGKKLIVNDVGGVAVPGSVLNVYRSGHSGSTTNGSDQNVWYDSTVSITFTPLSASSIFVVWYNIGVNLTDSGGDAGFSLRLKRVHNSTTSYPTGLDTDASGGSNRHSFWYTNANPTSTNLYQMANVHGNDTDSHGTASITYTVQFASYNAGNLQVGLSYGARTLMTVMEIAQ
jgi:hypothetical protein